MPKKNGLPTKAEIRIREKIIKHGGYIVVTRDASGEHISAPDGKHIITRRTLEKFVGLKWMLPAQDGLWAGNSQTYWLTPLQLPA